jgi:hypothetical protein
MHFKLECPNREVLQSTSFTIRYARYETTLKDPGFYFLQDWAKDIRIRVDEIRVEDLLRIKAKSSYFFENISFIGIRKSLLLAKHIPGACVVGSKMSWSAGIPAMSKETPVFIVSQNGDVG